MGMNEHARKLIVVHPPGGQNETILHAALARSFEAAAERIGGCALLGAPRHTRQASFGQRLGHTQAVLLPGIGEAEMRWVESVSEACLPAPGKRETALYTLGHRHDGVGDLLKAYVFAASVAEAIAGWRANAVTYENQLPFHGAVCAKLHFPPALFREPDATDRALAGVIPVELVYDGPLGLWITRSNAEGLFLYLRRYDLLT